MNNKSVMYGIKDKSTSKYLGRYESLDDVPVFTNYLPFAKHYSSPQAAQQLIDLLVSLNHMNPRNLEVVKIITYEESL